MKKAHVDKIPGIKEFVTEFLKGGVIGGYLTKLGMIASTEADHKVANEAANSFVAMDRRGFEIKLQQTSRLWAWIESCFGPCPCFVGAEFREFPAFGSKGARLGI